MHSAYQEVLSGGWAQFFSLAKGVWQATELNGTAKPSGSGGVKAIQRKTAFLSELVGYIVFERMFSGSLWLWLQPHSTDISCAKVFVLIEALTQSISQAALRDSETVPTILLFQAYPPSSVHTHRRLRHQKWDNTQLILSFSPWELQRCDMKDGVLARKGQPESGHLCIVRGCFFWFNLVV